MNSRSNVSSETNGATSNTMNTVAGCSTLQETLDRFRSEQEEWHKQQEKNGRLESHRNAITIAASLFAAAAFQAGVNPPGGFWQDTVISNNTSTKSHFPGQSILADSDPWSYQLISTANATAFFNSSWIFLLLLSGLPLKNKVSTGILMVEAWIVIVAAGYSFLVSTKATGSESFTHYRILPYAIRVYVLMFVSILLGHIGLFLGKKVSKHGSSSSSTAATANRSSV
ncbi:hypothetical protein Nepgr_009074 [Nepenthes gracilis]|uniref:PGG domain-containing protein n=1 Tax=Nepenthes gracilis TaxID=150966 RepID=A0AAD3SA98_NEPGR|nr:hypothetical protein Nepgr_009074 [Nepenthes gracilis]